MKVEILTCGLSVRLKEYDSGYGKDVGHSEQQDSDKHHGLCEEEIIYSHMNRIGMHNCFVM